MILEDAQSFNKVTAINLEMRFFQFEGFFCILKIPFLSVFYSKIMFVLQIGSISQTDSCNTNLSDPNTVDKAVLLQYSVNNGITWQVIAQHQPKDFIQAQRVSYNVPL